MKKNPLQKIVDWLTSLPREIQKEIVAIGGHFHPKAEIYKSSGDEQLKLFTEYLNESLNDREIVIRTFLITKLIDHAVSGRDSEEGWTETLDRHISLGASLKGEGKSTKMVDDFIKSYDTRKEIWIETSTNWYNFRDNNINDRQISNWYFFNTFK